MIENRTIKFRVWNNKSKSWIHSPNKNPSLDGVNLFGETILLGGFMDKVSIEDLNDCIALQYTGLNDKNEREIFEGDIVKFHYFGFDGGETDNLKIGHIFYDSKLCSFVIETQDNNCFYFGDTSHFEEPCIEILGNIYENQDLLK